MVQDSTRLKKIMLYTFLSFMFLLSIFPLYWMFVIATHPSAAVSQFPPAIFPGDQFIININNVFDSIPFLQNLLNSIIVSTTITVFTLFICSLAGFAFAKLRFRGRNFLFIFVLATLAVPVQLGLIPQYMIVSSLGWVDSLIAVIVPGVINAFGVFWMRQYIAATIPDDLLDAGRIDGARNFRLYWNITVPAIRPAFATLAIIVFMHHWNDFLWPLVVLHDNSSHTIQIALRALNEAYTQDYGMIMAGTFLATLPMIIVFIIFSRQFIAGILEGSLK